MREEHQPFLGNGSLIEPLALRDGFDGIEIVSHDPGWVEMCAGGDEIGDVAGVLRCAAPLKVFDSMCTAMSCAVWPGKSSTLIPGHISGFVLIPSVSRSVI